MSKKPKQMTYLPFSFVSQVHTEFRVLHWFFPRKPCFYRAESSHRKSSCSRLPSWQFSLHQLCWIRPFWWIIECLDINDTQYKVNTSKVFSFFYNLSNSPVCFIQKKLLFCTVSFGSSRAAESRCCQICFNSALFQLAFTLSYVIQVIVRILVCRFSYLILIQYNARALLCRWTPKGHFIKEMDVGMEAASIEMGKFLCHPPTLRQRRKDQTSSVES